MNSNERTTLSRTLSKILRHKAHDEGLTLRADGYISVASILSRPKLSNLKADLEKIQEVVAKDNKTRFTMMQEEGGEWFIRANQGHSLAVDELSLTPITDAKLYPTVLHGTSMAAWDRIQSLGLSKMKRNHIHCATGAFGTVKSGVRRNCEVFIHIDLPKAMHDGIRFFESSNGVILTSGMDGTLAPQYFSHVEAADGSVLVDRRDQSSPAVTRVGIRTALGPRDLFGSTIETAVPKSWLDASLLRQVPDTQEVFLDPDNADRSFIVELVERLDVSDPDAGTEHYKVLSEDNDAAAHHITKTEVILPAQDGQDCKILVSGSQKIAKFNTPTQKEISVVMGIVRLAKVSTDVLLMYNAPYSADTVEDGMDIVRAALDRFKVKDWSLFPECC
ncbi:Putative tRNA 2'-phosphotransferase [Taphrina deformans PYCC 5710]|uniref:2'-phosphotransferase n=1 Tax=Taphrina deformans (strain PYCC 5710 / ATCC 11124 / CBS 356.35 / IMI 108563 / JCM 9778 / NBRC 8474) TaxID=1097556 RepID=R4X965_TAPDE|nr:Putative tRNA 2'-phosphotransferase [Taphrina deformans PYCC 5710]|eukprot:CCG82215.1 Putative tRNA 2'-phosphotransferase [Taphrina deformans PYCC 5710]